MYDMDTRSLKIRTAMMFTGDRSIEASLFTARALPIMDHLANVDFVNNWTTAVLLDLQEMDHDKCGYFFEGVAEEMGSLVKDDKAAV